MADSKENKEELEKWLVPLYTLTVEEFCHHWVPIIYDISPQHPKYRKYSTELLARVTDKSRKTVQNWLTSRQPVPDSIERVLGTVDALWKIRFFLADVFPEIRK